MARIKRVPHTAHTDGEWQMQQLEQGWYTADFDFDTNEFVMKRCEDIETITPQQARLLSYNDPNDLTDHELKILWPELYTDEGQQ